MLIGNDLSNGMYVLGQALLFGLSEPFLATGDRGIEKPSFILGIVGKLFPPLFS